MKMKNMLIVVPASLVLLGMWVFKCKIAEKPMSPSSLLTTRDLNVIESYVHFKFPQSTQIVRAYWEGMETQKHYIFFEFDRIDIKHVMKTLEWKNEVVGDFKGGLSWYEEKDVRNLDYLTGAVSKEYYTLDSSPPTESLEWWKPDRKKINSVFWIYDAKLKGFPVYVDTFILLEESEMTCRAYVYISWSGLSRWGGYEKGIRELFPMHHDWKYREKKSKPFPFRDEDMADK